MESFLKHKLLKHTLIFIFVLLFSFFFHLFVPFIVQTEFVRATQSSQISQESQSSRDAAGLMERGKELYEAGNFLQATTFWEKAVKAYQQEQDSLNQVLALNNLSATYQELGNWKDGEEAISKALYILRSVAERQNNDVQLSHAYAQVLDTNGHLKYVLGQTQKALDNWKQAAQIYKRLNDNEGITINKINQAQALQSLGSLRQAKDNLDELEESLKNQTNSHLQIKVLHSLANTYTLLGNFNKSKELLSQGLEFYQKNHNFGVNKQEESHIFLSLGNTQRALANRERERMKAQNYQEYKECKIYQKPQEKELANEALNYYAKALSTARGISPLTEIQAESNQLSLYLELNQEYEAKNLWNKIQSQNLDKLPPSRANIYAQINLAKSLSCFNSLEKADYNLQRKELLSNAIKQAQIIGDKRAESYAFGNLGHLYENISNFLAAQQQTEKGLAIAKSYHTPDIAYRLQWQLGRIHKAQGDKKTAIKYYEEAVETLKYVRQDLLNINSEIQFSFRDSVEPVYRELVGLLLDSNKSFKIEPDYLQQAISTVDSLQLAEMENFFRCNLSQLVRVNQEISKKNLPAVFIYPIILRDKLVVIYQLPGGKLEQHTEYISYKEVESTAKNLRNAIANRRGITNYSQEIYKWIMKPLFDEYLTSENEVETLVFVLDGYLRNIPVAALWDEEGGKDKEGEYLIQKKYSLALLPGSQFFDLEDKSHNQSILAVGIDTLNKNKEKQYYVEGKPFTAIDISELDKIGAKKKLINDKFTQSNLQKEIKTGKFSVVHIASHGNFSSNPEETYIVAYNSKDSRGKLLKAKDLDNLFQVSNQKDFGTIKLLVLSACDTAGGDNRAILGLAGLAVKAGARSTLSTLWRVEDNATTELMERFYKEWKAKEVTKAEALHRAQLALLENPKTQHPYKWAPYILIGNWQ